MSWPFRTGPIEAVRGAERAYVDRAHVVVNNCYHNFGIMDAATMSQILRCNRILSG